MFWRQNGIECRLVVENYYFHQLKKIAKVKQGLTSCSSDCLFFYRDIKAEQDNKSCPKNDGQYAN